MEQWDRVKATFQPVRTDDLRDGIEKWIGVESQWVVGWIIDEGPYEGQQAMLPSPSEDEMKVQGIMPVSWVPVCDLRIQPIIPLGTSDCFYDS